MKIKKITAILSSGIILFSGMAFGADNLSVGAGTTGSTGVSTRDEVLRQRQNMTRAKEERTRRQADRLQSDQNRRDQLNNYKKGYEREMKRTEDYTGPSGLYDKALVSPTDPLKNKTE